MTDEQQDETAWGYSVPFIAAGVCKDPVFRYQQMTAEERQWAIDMYWEFHGKDA